MNNKVIQRVPYGEAYVRIVEQPKRKGYRFPFVYHKSVAHIYGVNSNDIVKSYPSIEIVNYNGPALVVVCCVTRDYPHYPHPYKIVSESENTHRGIYQCTIPRNKSIIKFPQLAIQCMRKRDMIESLEEREQTRGDPFKTGINRTFKYDNFSLRLCFQVFVEGLERGVLNVPLDPVVSDPLFDRRNVKCDRNTIEARPEFTILWLSHKSASAAGREVMCILSERIVKHDIQVRFFNKDNGWNAIAETAYPHYHKEVGIIFTCPKYLEENIRKPVTVQVELRRASNGVVSPPVTFEYLPVKNDDPNKFKTKRQKLQKKPMSLIPENILPSDKALDLSISTNWKDRIVVVPHPYTVTTSQLASLLHFKTEPQMSVMPLIAMNVLSEVKQEVDRSYSDDESDRLRTFKKLCVPAVAKPQAINYSLPKYSVNPKESHKLYLPIKSIEICKPVKTINFSNNLQNNHKSQQSKNPPKKQKVETPKKTFRPWQD